MTKLLRSTLFFLTLLASALFGTANAQAIPESQFLNHDEVMIPDKFYFSPNGQYFIVFQSTDGNLVVYKAVQPTNRAIWSAGTNRGRGRIAAMQGDGNFVVYNDAGSSLWDSATWGLTSPGGAAFINDHGQFIVRGRSTFNTPADPQPPAPTPGIPCSTGVARQYAICSFPNTPNQFNGWIAACNASDAQRIASSLGVMLGRCPGT